jgi:hypothetical protein
MTHHLDCPIARQDLADVFRGDRRTLMATPNAGDRELLERARTVGGTMSGQRTQQVGSWPRLRVADWVETRDTLHMWAQIVGKIRLAHAPMVNHW